MCGGSGQVRHAHLTEEVGFVLDELQYDLPWERPVEQQCWFCVLVMCCECSVVGHVCTSCLVGAHMANPVFSFFFLTQRLCIWQESRVGAEWAIAM